jgi:hypothetical protein
MEARKRRGKGCGVGANQFIGAYRYGFRPLGAVAQRHARHAHDGGFFGYTAAVGNDSPCVTHQIVELQVRLRLHHAQAGGFVGQRGQGLGGTGVNGKHHRQVASAIGNSRQQTA